jgi:hypothetical protein
VISAFIGHAYQHSSFFAQTHLPRASHSTITTTQQHTQASLFKRWRYPSEGAEHISIPPHITTTSKSDRTRSELWIAFEQAHETNDISIARTYLLSQQQLPQRIRRQRTNESHDACSRITKSQEPKDTPCLRTLATTDYSTSRPERRRTRTPALVRTERRIFNALARFLHSWLHHDFSPYH